MKRIRLTNWKINSVSLDFSVIKSTAKPNNLTVTRVTPTVYSSCVTRNDKSDLEIKRG